MQKDTDNQKSVHSNKVRRNIDRKYTTNHSKCKLFKTFCLQKSNVSHATQMKYQNHLFVIICGIQPEVSQLFCDIHVLSTYCVQKRSILKCSTLKISWTNIDLCKFSGAQALSIIFNKYLMTNVNRIFILVFACIVIEWKHFPDNLCSSVSFGKALSTVLCMYCGVTEYLYNFHVSLCAPFCHYLSCSNHQPDPDNTDLI